jgi:Protein of unknown function (DUF2924)
MFWQDPTLNPKLSVTRKVAGDLDSRLPPHGSYLEREYKGRRVIVKVLVDGFEFEGRVYRSLSAIAREVTGTKWNGFLFFNEKRWPSQQVESQVGEQKPVSGYPADGLQHEQGPGNEVRRRRWGDERCQGGAQTLGMTPKTAYPELPPLVGHALQHGGDGGDAQSAAAE